MGEKDEKRRVSGWSGYLITVFAITVAVVYGPLARHWFVSQGIDSYTSGTWAALSGLAVAAAGAWLVAAAMTVFASVLENLKVDGAHRELAEIAERFDGVDDEELRHQWIESPGKAGHKHYFELKRRGYFDKVTNV